MPNLAIEWPDNKPTPAPRTAHVTACRDLLWSHRQTGSWDRVFLHHVPGRTFLVLRLLDHKADLDILELTRLEKHTEILDRFHDYLYLMSK
jgi:hypothetical protein